MDLYLCNATLDVEDVSHITRIENSYWLNVGLCRFARRATPCSILYVITRRVLAYVFYYFCNFKDCHHLAVTIYRPPLFVIVLG